MLVFCHLAYRVHDFLRIILRIILYARSKPRRSKQEGLNQEGLNQEANAPRPALGESPEESLQRLLAWVSERTRIIEEELSPIADG